MEQLTGLFGPDRSGTNTTTTEFDEFDDFEAQLEQLEIRENDDEQEEKDEELPAVLPRERFHGNVEYKRQLTKPTRHRLTHLTTQMQFRLTEGGGECRYLIGVNDNGTYYGLDRDTLNETIRVINQMAKQLNGETRVTRTRNIDHDKVAAEILVRQHSTSRLATAQPIAILGNGDAGKSTLVATLTNGELDNGRGRSRLHLFRHPHEISSGKTSCISIDFLGFDQMGRVLQPGDYRDKDELLLDAAKIVEFWDLAGDQRYMKTTAYGLTSASPSFCIITISANKGILGTTEEHLMMAQALNLSILIVITKTDLCSGLQLEGTIKQVTAFLGRIPFSLLPIEVDSNDKVANVVAQLTRRSPLVPIFSTSAVTGAGLALLTAFLGQLPARQFDAGERQGPILFQVDRLWLGSGGGAMKCHGRLLSGVLKQGERVRIGPDRSGAYSNCTVRQIKRNNAQLRLIEAGQLATLEVASKTKLDDRKGMYLVSETEQEISCWEFDAQVKLMRCSTSGADDTSPKENSLRCGQTVTVHVANIRQTCLITQIDGSRLGRIGRDTTQTVSIRLKFIQHPVLLHANSSFLIRESGTRASGIVTKLI